MKLRTWQLVVLPALLMVVGGISLFTGVEAAEGDPPILPAGYTGSVTFTDGTDPEGFAVSARIEDYTSQEVQIQGGRYPMVKVIAPNVSYNGKRITFHIGDVQANESDVFEAGGGSLHFDLTFASAPSPTPTPTPVIVAPEVYAGVIIIPGEIVPAGAALIARVGEYESLPAVINLNQSFLNLVVDPRDDRNTGMEVKFFLNGIEATSVTPPILFTPGRFTTTVNLIFPVLPRPTPEPVVVPTSTTVPTTTPTEVSAKPTALPSPTATALPSPTATTVPVVPTATALPSPTATVVASPTATTVPPTATAVPPMPTSTAVLVSEKTPENVESSEEESVSGGGCNSRGEDVGKLTAMMNTLWLLAPIGLIAGLRRWRRQKADKEG